MLPALRERDASLVKIAVVMLSSPGKVTQFIEMDQNLTLADIIQRICVNWGIPDPENYVLQTFDSKHQYYITDSNKNDIKKGSILRLEVSPAKSAQDMLVAINTTSTFDQYAALARLSYMSADLPFAEEFIKQGNLLFLINNIEQGKYKDNSLKYALISVMELMRHDIANWDIFEDLFITKICYCVNNQPRTHDTKIIESCLFILENVILKSSKNLQMEKKITIPNLMQHLQNPKQDWICQKQVISFINAALIKADYTRKTAIITILSSKQCRSIIYGNVIGANDSSKMAAKKGVATELSHQLYVLQTLMLNMLEPRMKQRADAEEKESKGKLKELRKIAFGSQLNLKVAAKLGAPFFKSEYQNLGFDCEDDQMKDFNEVPPGVLTLDCMLYFAKNYSKDYKNIIQKNACISDGHEFPFGKTSVQLVKSLCDILYIGESPSEVGLEYYPLVFSHEKPFEELFCVCIVLLHKTWVEMKAKTEDVHRVLSVVTDQIINILSTTPKNFDEFREKINQKSLEKITKLWIRVRNSCRKKTGNFI